MSIRYFVQRTSLDHRYILGILLGSGGMGEIYLAHGYLLGRDVTLKVLLFRGRPGRRLRGLSRSVAGATFYAVMGAVGFVGLFAGDAGSRSMLVNWTLTQRESRSRATAPEGISRLQWLLWLGIEVDHLSRTRS
jgi:serine/threonine protein kinase